jgi:hypothetical protein
MGSSGAPAPRHEGAESGNGSYESAPPPPVSERESAPPREFHAEPRTPHESSAREGAPLAHFEPAPKPEGSGQNKPYVVWSSAPPQGDTGGSRGSEE